MKPAVSAIASSTRRGAVFDAAPDDTAPGLEWWSGGGGAWRVLR